MEWKLYPDYDTHSSRIKYVWLLVVLLSSRTQALTDEGFLKLFSIGDDSHSGHIVPSQRQV